MGLGSDGLMILEGPKILEEGAQINKYYFWAEKKPTFFFLRPERPGHPPRSIPDVKPLPPIKKKKEDYLKSVIK